MDAQQDLEAPRTEFRIPEQNLASLKAKLARLAKRAAKLGAEAPTLTVHAAEEIHLDNGTVEVFYPVTVTGPAPSFDGWTLDAVIELDHDEPDAPNVVHVLDGVESDPAWRTLAERCDHCNVDNRRRAKLVVVRHTDGTRKVIGTTCIRDFLGHQAPADVARWAEYVADLDVADYEDRDFCGERAEQRYDAAEYLGWVVRSCAESGWRPRSAGGYGTPTADDALGQLQLANGLRKPSRGEERPEPLTAAERAEGAAAAAWAAEVAPTNDYLANLNAVALKTSLRHKDLGIAASAVSSYAKAQEREIERAARAESTANSVHVGTVGQRLEFTGTVSYVREIPGDYGTRAMVKILSEGNLLVWWCSNADNAPRQGQTVTGKATVKAHETYQGEVQTVITRAKLEVAG